MKNKKYAHIPMYLPINIPVSLFPLCQALTWVLQEEEEEEGP